MPYAAPHPCRFPGCPELVQAGRYCTAHTSTVTSKGIYDQTRRRNDPALALAAKIRNTSQWRRVRAIHRTRAPLCCDPFKAHPSDPMPNQQSHHIEPLALRPDLAFDFTNLAAVCTGCHDRISRMERAGEPTRHLFVKSGGYTL